MRLSVTNGGFSIRVRFFLCYENQSFSYRHRCCNRAYTVTLIAVYTALMLIIIQIQVFVFLLLTPSVFRRKPGVTHLTSGLLTSYSGTGRVFRQFAGNVLPAAQSYFSCEALRNAKLSLTLLWHCRSRRSDEFLKLMISLFMDTGIKLPFPLWNIVIKVTTR